MPKGENYKGSHWFFENPNKDIATKEDSFVCIKYQNVYEMDGVTPQDDSSHFIDINNDEEDEENEATVAT